jgi:hypothetical protein
VTSRYGPATPSPHNKREKESVMPPFMTVHEAAEVLKVNPGTLDNWRSMSKGPPYHRVCSRILYSKADITRYLASTRVTPKVKRGVVTA